MTYTLRIATDETKHISLVTLACAIKDVININSVELVNEEFHLYSANEEKLVIYVNGEMKPKGLSSYERLELNKIMKNLDNMFPKRKIKLGTCDMILQH